MFFTKTHEWINKVNDNEYAIGISDHAQSELSDIVFVDLPSIGTELEAGTTFMVVESVKAASDIYAPINGEIIAVNEKLTDTPELINESPENEGWLIKVKCTEEQIQQIEAMLSDKLLSKEEYSQLH